MRVARHHRAGVGDLHALERLARPLERLRVRSRRGRVNTSATCVPTLIDGFSAVPGFW